MFVHIEKGMVYTQTWDVDNRLIDVVSGTQHTQFYYDADGGLVKKVDPRGTTAYVGADDEVLWLVPTQTVTVTVPATFTHKLYLPMVAMGGLNAANGVSTTYYRFNGQRVAMRQGNAVYWIHGDHLGSASLTTSITGTVVSEMRYTPYGETRYSSGDTPTDQRFTGQRQDGSLYDFGARFFDPQIGRFISADTFIQDPYDPQTLNRYAYARGNPLRYTDPSGHFAIPLLIGGALAIGAAAYVGYVYYFAPDAAQRRAQAAQAFQGLAVSVDQRVNGLQIQAATELAMAANQVGIGASQTKPQQLVLPGFEPYMPPGPDPDDDNDNSGKKAEDWVADKYGTRANRGPNRVGIKQDYFTSKTKFRIPDINPKSTPGKIVEIKDRIYVGLDENIPDFIKYAEQNNLKVELWVRRTATIQKTLLEMTQGENPLVILKYLFE